MLREYRLVFRDIVILLAIPGVLAALHFFLPDTIRSQLVFTYGESGVVAAWTSAYLHASNGHLYNNLFGYAISAGFSYYLYIEYLRQRRRFWITIAVLLIVTPFITTVVDYTILYRYTGLLATGATSQGFSGISSAFGGVLLAAVGLFVADEYNGMTGTHTALLIFLVALGVLTAANGILTPLIAGLLTVGVVLLGTQYVSRRDLQQPSRLRTRVEQHAANIVQVIAYGAVVCIFVYLILPIEVVQSGNFVNILAHSVGFVIGIVGSTITAPVSLR
jgi:hypothetical protein